jgi:hypothetical protein
MNYKNLDTLARTIVLAVTLGTLFVGAMMDGNKWLMFLAVVGLVLLYIAPGKYEKENYDL